MVQALSGLGLRDLAVEALNPMVNRAVQFNGFYEWFDFKGNPQGSGSFHGAAGSLGLAISMIQSIAD
jgi:hypothetical protein